LVTSRILGDIDHGVDMADQELKQALTHGSPKIKLNSSHYERVVAGKAERTLAYERVLDPGDG
jgi:hypothetical protein